MASAAPATEADRPCEAIFWFEEEDGPITVLAEEVYIYRDKDACDPDQTGDKRVYASKIEIRIAAPPAIKRAA